MKVKLKHKEVLLVRKVFTSRQICKIRDRLAFNPANKEEKLVEAFNNLLLSMMPEILERNSVIKKLTMCKMTESLLLLELKFGEINLELELQYSINPSSFLRMQILS